MATNRIKGITIEIGGDTTKLTDSLKNVDRSLKETQADLKDVNKLLKLDPSNVELLRQKHDLLEKAIGDTKTRQEELQKALEQAKGAGDTEENRRQQDLLQRELIETQQSLQKYESEMAETENVTRGASDAMKDSADSASTFGDTLKAKLTGEAVISAVKKLGSAMKGLALDAAALSDEIATQSQVTGLSTDTLQEYAYMADLVDVEVGTITGSMAKLTKSMSSASKGSGDAYDAFKRLGVSATNLDGSLRSNEDVFNDLVDALGGIRNETERDAIAMTLFGKSAKELNPLINAGSKQLKAYAQEAHDVGYVMGKDVIERNLEASDALARMKKAAEATKNTIGSALAPAVTKAATALSKLATGVQNNLGTFKKVGEVVGIATGAFLAYKGIVAAIELPTKAAAAAQKLLNTTMIANPIVAVTAAMAALFITLDKFSRKTYDISEDVKAMKAEMASLNESVQATSEAWDSVTAAADRHIQGAEAEFAYYGDLATELNGIVDANGKVKEGYESRAEVITGILSEALGVEIELTDGIIKNYDTLSASIDELIEKKKAELVMQAQEEAYAEALRTRQTAALNLVKAEQGRSDAEQKAAREREKLSKMEAEQRDLQKQGYNDYNAVYLKDLDARIEAKQKEVQELEAASQTANDAYNESKRIVQDATYSIQVYEQNLQAVTRGEYDKIITANADVARSYNDLDAEGRKAMDSLTGSTAALGSELYANAKSAGEDFLNGFIKGIENRTPAAKQTVSNVGVSGKKWLKASLDENSPSKATEEMGEFFVEGLEIGIKSQASSLFAQIARFGQNTLATFQNATSAGFGLSGDVQLASSLATGANAMTSMSPASVGGVNVSVVVNGTVDNYDALAETIGQKLQQQMARERMAFA